MSASPVLSTPALPLIFAGVFTIFLAAWLTTVDAAISRMSLSYALELKKDGRRGAPSLVAAVKARGAAPANLLAVRSTVQTLGFVSFILGLAVLVARLGWPWWAVFVATLAGAWLVQLAALGASISLLAGSRYVSVALSGSKVAAWAFSLKPLPRLPSRREAQAGGEVDSAESRLKVVENLRELVDQVETLGGVDALPEEDREMIRSVFQLGSTRVGELMVPRGEMVTIKAGEDAEEALRLFVTSGYSRIPVVGKNLDDIVGVLYLKDVVGRGVQEGKIEGATAGALARNAAFIPEMKLADVELRDMQAGNNHIALVVDEYGGIAGLVTAEDILEELVGELVDEHDRKGSTPVEVSEGTWQVPTSMAIDDLAELLDCEIDEDDIYSVGGLLSKATGKVLIPGATADVDCVRLTAGDSVGRRRKVLTVFATKLDDAAGSVGEEETK